VKIACIGDVHGNLPALDAVLTHARLQGAAAIWNVGDFVGYGPFPEEVVQRLRAIDAISIRGNYDRKTLHVPKKREKWAKTKSPDKLLAFQWAYDHLSAESHAYLASLPEKMELECQGWKVLLVHGSPEDPDEHLTLETPQTRLDDLAQTVEADIILCGHSHQAFFRESGSVWWINTGTVGRPDSGDPRAEYALLELEPHHREVVHYRVSYDLDRIVQAIHQHKLPSAFAQMFQQGRDYDWIKNHYSDSID
jgi:putative phosphoesterase